MRPFLKHTLAFAQIPTDDSPRRELLLRNLCDAQGRGQLRLATAGQWAQAFDTAEPQVLVQLWCEDPDLALEQLREVAQGGGCLNTVLDANPRYLISV